jgi:hypothetical protein
MPHTTDLHLKIIESRKGRESGLMPSEVLPSYDQESRGGPRAACISLSASLAAADRRRDDA